MGRLLSISRRASIGLFVLLDIVSLGMGMGVPFFTILIGFPVGWFTARRQQDSSPEAMRQCFKVALLTSAVSLCVLAVLWLPWVPVAWGTEAELVQTGIPMILYEPRASFIGWIALMVVISPVLQVLTTLSSSFIVLMRHSSTMANQRIEQMRPGDSSDQEMSGAQVTCKPLGKTGLSDA